MDRHPCLVSKGDLELLKMFLRVFDQDLHTPRG